MSWPRHLESNANAFYLLGVTSLELGKPAEAVNLLNKSLRQGGAALKTNDPRFLDPDFRAPYVNLGVAYLRLKLFEEAIHISEACLDRHPSSPQCQRPDGNRSSKTKTLKPVREGITSALPLANWHCTWRRGTEAVPNYLLQKSGLMPPDKRRSSEACLGQPWS